MQFVRRLYFWFFNILGLFKLSRYDRINSDFYSVLMYHGVEEDKYKRSFRPYDLSQKSIIKEIEFYIMQGYQICSVVDIHSREHVPNSNLVITFDDGNRNITQSVRYLSNYYNIRPIIAICPGVIDSRAPFWFEEIYARLQLTQSSHAHSSCEGVSDPHDAYLKVMDYYFVNHTLMSKDLLSDIREATLDIDLKQVLAHPAVHQNLDWDELYVLVDQNLCTIAAHTMHHESVVHMDSIEFENDLLRCQQLIKKNLNIDCEHFVYPFGDHLNHWESEILSDCAISFSYIVDDKINVSPISNYYTTRTTGKDISKDMGYYRYLWHKGHSNLTDPK